MKKTVCAVIITFILISLCGCGKADEHTPRGVTYPYSSELKVLLDGREYRINATLEAAGVGVLTFSSPSGIRGLKLTFGKDGATLSYCGVKVPIDTEYASKHGILMLRDILSEDLSGFSGAKIVKRSGISYCRERYEGDGYRIDVYFADKEPSPAFIEAEVGGRKMEIIFVNNQ